VIKPVGKLAIFMTIGVALLVLANQLFIYGLRQVDYDDFGVWNQTVNGEINSDIVCTGSSRTLVHFDPRIIGKELGLTCFNLGLDGSPLNFQLPLLKSYLKHNRPPKILLQGLGVLSVHSRQNIYKAYQYIPYLDEEPIYQNLVRYDPKFWRYRYLPGFGFATYGLQLRSFAFDGLMGRTQESNRIMGFTPVYQDWTDAFDRFKEENPNGVTYEIEPEALNNLREIIRLAREKGSQVILVYSPEYYENQELTNNFDEIMESFRAISKEMQVPFFEYSKDSLSYHRELFYNSQHLNAKGAELFSHKLASRLQEVVDQTELAQK